VQIHERSEVYCLNFVEVADVQLLWIELLACALVAMLTAADGTPLH